MTLAQKVRFDPYRKVVLFGHRGIMARTEKVFQSAFRSPYSD
jgi:hypothetical protein